jgi:putative transposase
MFKHCFGASRFFYNRSIKVINDRYEARKAQFIASPTCIHCTAPKVEGSWSCTKHVKTAIPWKLKVSLPSIRPEVMASDKDAPSDMLWQKHIPYDTRQMAIGDAKKAYVTCATQIQLKIITHFELKPRSKKNIHQTFWINPDAFQRNWSIFPTRLKNKKKLRMRKRQRKMLKELLPKGATSYVKIQRSGDVYYLVVSYDNNKPKEVLTKKEVISLDPGVRTFQSGYTRCGECYEFGDAQKEIIHKLHKKLDLLKNQRSKCSSKTKKRIACRVHQVEKRIQDVISDLHNQTASYLSKSYDRVVLGKLPSARLLGKGKLPPCVNRMLQCLSHYKFRMKLEGCCKQHGTQLIIQNESYTTKTCGRCGCLNHEVGSSKIFECNQCGLKSDRDLHAARNILLKHLSENASRQ